MNPILAEFKSKTFFALVLLLLIFMIWGLFKSSSGEVKKNGVVINGASIDVELATNLLSQQRGLSGRDHLPANQGMLFVYDHAKRLSFWMKDMNFSIDIIWIDENFHVAHVHHNITPESFPAGYTSPVQVPYVLEVNAGFAINHNVKPGDNVKFNLDLSSETNY